MSTPNRRFCRKEFKGNNLTECLAAWPTWFVQCFGAKKKEKGVVTSASDVKHAKMTGEIIESNGLQRQAWRCKAQHERRGGNGDDALTSLLPFFCSLFCASPEILPERRSWSSNTK
jgi:hypothetical protein